MKRIVTLHKNPRVKQKIANHSILAMTIGLVYLWFGALKYFPGGSPAENLAINTINLLTFSLIPGQISIILLAVTETLIGLLLLLNIFRRQVVLFALGHMALTFTPLFFFPNQSFGDSMFSLTLLGQYIFKNLIIVGALITLYQDQNPIQHN